MNNVAMDILACFGYVCILCFDYVCISAGDILIIGVILLCHQR